ncbi:enolase [Kribbella sp. NBC_00382]|uniref:mandelate racemase/muconate lactonizing enzyme family protein n=1 Tax=Kribbella sp. NBC_00382 TaxID=2975967 RepID=UPI002E1C2F18
MKITRIETIPYSIPFTKPLYFASGVVTSAEHVLVRVHTDEGLIGTADAPPRPYTYGETQASIAAAINDLFAPGLIGLSPLDRETAHAHMNRTVGNPVAKAAVDMALWDLVGLSLGVSVSQLLGGYTDRMRVAHMIGFSETDAMVADALRMRDQHGITSFKIKVGRHPIELDIQACLAVRDALGPQAELYIDGNRGWTAAESLRALHALDGVGLLFAEELCPADDVLGRRWLVQHSHLPIYADESVTTPAEVTREVLGGAATGISIKTARTGFTASQRVLNLCQGLGIEVVMGNQIDGQVGSLCTATFGAAFKATAGRPGELSNFLDMSNDLLAEPLAIEDGVLLLPQRPGIGIEIDEAKLDRYRQDR